MKAKKILAALLSSAMVLGTMAVPVFAADAIDTYEEFAAAIDSVEDYGTITLGGNVTMEKKQISNGKIFTIDLNGNTLDVSGIGRGLEIDNAFVTVKNGTLKANSASGQGVNVYGSADSSKIAGAYNSLTLDSVTVDAYYAVILRQNAAVTTAGYGSKITVKNSTLNGNVWVLGNIQNGNAVIDLEGNTSIATAADIGVALQGNATVNVENGVTISAKTGIEVAGGTLNFNGGKVTGTGTPTTAEADNNGTTTSGAGIAVSPYGYSTPTVNIKDGEIEGYSALYSTNVRNAKANKESVVNVNGGIFNGSKYGIFNENGTVTVTEGVINATEQGIRGKNDSKIVVNGGNITGQYGICLFEKSSLKMTGGTVNASDYGVTNNGTVTTHGPNPMDISGGTITAGITGIYHAGLGELKVSGNAAISGGTGIEMRAGTLTMTDGTVTSKASEESVVANGNGNTTLGAGIAVAQHTTKQPINVSVSGGKVSGYYGLYEVNPQQNSDADISKISINVSGGNITATGTGREAVKISDSAVAASVTGGTFSTDPQAYVAQGYAAVPSDDVYSGDAYNVKPVSNLEKNDIEKVLNNATTDTTATITSAVKNGKYELVSAAVVDISDMDETTKSFKVVTTSKPTGYIINLTNIAGETTYSGAGKVLCGLIITEIPQNETVTVTVVQ